MSCNRTTKLLVILFVISLFIGGVIFEAVSWLTLFALMYGARKSAVAHLGKKGFCSMLAFAGVYACLFAAQLGLGIIRPAQAIRLLGLTKSIVAPVIFYFAFYRRMKTSAMWPFRAG